MTRMSKRNAKEIREGIMDARRGTERPWEYSMQKQGPYWNAHQRTVKKIVALNGPVTTREKKLALELDLLDDRICDLIGGDDSRGLLWQLPEENREAIQTYLLTWVEEYREVREHYGLDYE